MQYQKLLDLAQIQNGVVSRAQMLDIGFHSQEIKRRVAQKRLFRIHRGVYAVGRPQLSAHGYWSGAVLSCGQGAVLSHQSAGNLWEIADVETSTVHVSVPSERGRMRQCGISIHRRRSVLFGNSTVHRGIPVTTPVVTLVDLAAALSEKQLERAINEADKRNLTSPPELLKSLDSLSCQTGVLNLRRKLEETTLLLTDSELERMFLRFIKRIELPLPRTGQFVCDLKVDFFWPDVGLIVETDGLRYHRTPGQQAKDRYRDQLHASQGFTTLRFTYYQVKFEPGHVSSILLSTFERLRERLLR